MKTIKSVSLLAALTGIIMTGCSNEDIAESNNAPADNKITIEAYTDNGLQTRMGYEDDGSAVSIKWTEGDAFTIIPAKAGSPAQVFTLSEGANTHTATFTGLAPDLDASGYTVLYPATLGNTAAFDAFSYSGQKQTGNDNTTHLTAFHTIKLAVNSTDIASINFGSQGVAQSSLLVLNLKNLPEKIGTPQSVAIHAEDPCFAVTNNSVGTDVSLKLDGFPAVTSPANSIKAYLMLGVNGENATYSAGKKLTVTLTGTEGSCTAEFTSPDGGICFAGGKRNSITATKWTAEDVEEEIPYLFDITQGWSITKAEIEYLPDGTVKFTSTDTRNRCNPYMRDMSPAISLPGDKVLYYQAKALVGTQFSPGNVKVTIYIDGVMDINGTEGTITLAQYKADILDTDADGFQWVAFDLSQLGMDANHQADIKFKPTGGTETLYKYNTPDEAMYNALAAAIRGTDLTTKRMDFIMMSNLSTSGSEYESFIMKELGIASLSTVNKKIKK